MKLDLRTEQGVPLREVPQWIPKRNGKKVHHSTVYRWATKGVRGRILETVLIGGIRYTTVEAIERFADAPTVTTPDKVNSDDVEAALRAAGL